MELKTVPIEKPPDINFILGQSHFIKTSRICTRRLCRRCRK
jgi:adenosine/AMP kinase